MGYSLDVQRPRPEYFAHRQAWANMILFCRYTRTHQWFDPISGVGLANWNVSQQIYERGTPGLAIRGQGGGGSWIGLGDQSFAQYLGDATQLACFSNVNTSQRTVCGFSQTTGGTMDWYLELNATAAGRLRFRVRDTTTNANDQTTSADVGMADGNIHVVACSNMGRRGDGQMTLAIDGVDQTSLWGSAGARSSFQPLGATHFAVGGLLSNDSISGASYATTYWVATISPALTMEQMVLLTSAPDELFRPASRLGHWTRREAYDLVGSLELR